MVGTVRVGEGKCKHRGPKHPTPSCSVLKYLLPVHYSCFLPQEYLSYCICHGSTTIYCTGICYLIKTRLNQNLILTGQRETTLTLCKGEIFVVLCNNRKI